MQWLLVSCQKRLRLKTSSCFLVKHSQPHVHVHVLYFELILFCKRFCAVLQKAIRYLIPDSFASIRARKALFLIDMVWTRNIGSTVIRICHDLFVISYLYRYHVTSRRVVVTPHNVLSSVLNHHRVLEAVHVAATEEIKLGLESSGSR